MRGGRGSSVGSRAAVRRGPVSHAVTGLSRGAYALWCVERMVMVERAPMPLAVMRRACER